MITLILYFVDSHYALGAPWFLFALPLIQDIAIAYYIEQRAGK